MHPVSSRCPTVPGAAVTRASYLPIRQYHTRRWPALPVALERHTQVAPPHLGAESHQLTISIAVLPLHPQSDAPGSGVASEVGERTGPQAKPMFVVDHELEHAQLVSGPPFD